MYASDKGKIQSTAAKIWAAFRVYGGRSFGDERRVRCPEFRGGCFSEVANVWEVRSMTTTLSAIGSVSASRSVHSERFYCTSYNIDQSYLPNTHIAVVVTIVIASPIHLYNIV